MLIILALYCILVWLVFAKLKLVRLGWISGTVAAVIGIFILSVFLALLNYLTPSGTITVVSRVVEVMPNVTGQVVAIPVKTNVPVKVGTVLFQIDPTPFRFKVRQLEAGLVQAEQQAKQLRSNYDQASANVEGLTQQLAFTRQRLADMRTLASQQAMSEFREQDTQVQFETVNAQLLAAKAAQQSAKIALDAEIGGENPTVAQIKAQLDQAKWDLEQTSVRAPANGYVTVMALTVGDRALQARAALSFIVTDELTIVGMFAQNGFRTIKPGARVTLVFDNDPGRLHNATIAEIPEGVGQGQVAVSGTLARTTAVGGANAYPALISIPRDLDHGTLRLGMSGKATVFADNAGVIGLIAWILIWIGSLYSVLVGAGPQSNLVAASLRRHGQMLGPCVVGYSGHAVQQGSANFRGRFPRRIRST
jgi:multidrug resistance efflux pump